MGEQHEVKTTREEHPLLAVVTHWVHLIAIGVLIWTGFFISLPFYSGSMANNRTFHLIFAWVLLSTATVRLYWAFVGFSAPPGSQQEIPDYKFFAPQAENRGKLLPTLQYYLFLRRTHPKTAKYNPLQKGTYIFWGSLIMVQAITGFELWTPTASFFSPLTYALGGPDNVRIIHYLIMWLFIVTVALHIYLVFVEVIREVPLMFWWHETASEREKRS